MNAGLGPKGAQASSRDEAYMTRALELAARGLFTADPNPRVGCVLVRDGRIIGEGWHYRAGEPHAEVMALRSVGGSRHDNLRESGAPAGAGPG